MTIAARLLLGFLVSVLLLMGVGFFGLDRIGVVRDTTEAIVTHDIWAYRALQRIVQTQVTMIDARRATVVDFMMQVQHLGPALRPVQARPVQARPVQARPVQA